MLSLSVRAPETVDVLLHQFKGILFFPVYYRFWLGKGSEPARYQGYETRMTPENAGLWVCSPRWVHLHQSQCELFLHTAIITSSQLSNVLVF